MVDMLAFARKQLQSGAELAVASEISGFFRMER
jgi:hypothetical protein